MPSSLGIVASGNFGFSPLDLSPTIWLDASDTSTITASSGLVSQWNDKSGFGRNFTQSTSTRQPTTGASTQNGKNVLSFDGGDFLTYAALLDTGTAYTIACVITPSTSANAYAFMMHRSIPTVGQSAIITNYSSKAFESYNDGSSSVARFTLGSASLTGYNALIVVRNGSSLSSLVNGAASNTGSWNTVNYVWNSFFVGSANSGGYATNNVAEIVLIPSAVSGASLTSLSDYLRTKWATP